MIKWSGLSRHKMSLFKMVVMFPFIELSTIRVSSRMGPPRFVGYEMRIVRNSVIFFMPLPLLLWPKSNMKTAFYSLTTDANCQPPDDGTITEKSIFKRKIFLEKLVKISKAYLSVVQKKVGSN